MLGAFAAMLMQHRVGMVRAGFELALSSIKARLRPLHMPSAGSTVWVAQGPNPSTGPHESVHSAVQCGVPACRGIIPAKLSAGHFLGVYGNELWVFPMPRNHNMRRVYCLDLLRYR